MNRMAKENGIAKVWPKHAKVCTSLMDESGQESFGHVHSINIPIIEALRYCIHQPETDTKKYTETYSRIYRTECRNGTHNTCACMQWMENTQAKTSERPNRRRAKGAGSAEAIEKGKSQKRRTKLIAIEANAAHR